MPRSRGPREILIGKSPSQPVVSIKRLPVRTSLKAATEISSKDGVISRLGAMCQAVPSLLTAGAANGKQLMEVVISGDLVRATDGNGLRAFAMGPGGIKGNARLFEVKGLENIINAAVVWQIASVLVAQKHLADINKKLELIQQELKLILGFLEMQRRAQIDATVQYLGQAYQALQNGEFPKAVRDHLEACERDMLGIFTHLIAETEQKAKQRTTFSDFVGTEYETQAKYDKIQSLKPLTDQIKLCLQARIAAWHILSLFPGEQELKKARKANIIDSIDRVKKLAPDIDGSIKSDISEIKARLNRKSTIIGRQQLLLDELDHIVSNLSSIALGSTKLTKSCERLFLESDRPQRFLLQYEDGKLSKTLVLPVS